MTLSLTKPHGILFKAEMVRAILNTKPNVWPAEPIDGGKPFKWQTRRIMKPQPVPGMENHGIHPDGSYWFSDRPNQSGPYCNVGKCPHSPGTELWVRETFGVYRPMGYERLVYERSPIPAICPEEICVGNLEINRSDYGSRLRCVYRANGEINSMLWRNSLHMPRWASRISLVVKSVRVERVHDITEDDAFAEGFDRRLHFLNYFDEINQGGSGDPFVFVYEFMRTK